MDSGVLVIWLALALLIAGPARAEPQIDAIRLLGCRPPGVEGAEILLVSDTEPPWTRPVRRVGGTLEVRVDPRLPSLRAGSGTLAIPGTPPTPIAWEDSKGTLARCSPASLVPSEAGARVTGAVLTLSRSVEVAGCGGWTRADEGGDYEIEVLPSEDCQLWIRPGATDRWSPLARVSPRAGEVLEVPTRTLGIPLGPLLEWTLGEPWLPRVVRDESGLLRGDVLLSIGDRDLRRQPMKLDEAASALGACPGLVQAVVERDGQEVQVSRSCNYR